MRPTALWIKRDGGIKAINITKEDTVGDVAEVTIKVTRGGGDSSVVYYKLIWETVSGKLIMRWVTSKGSHQDDPAAAADEDYVQPVEKISAEQTSLA